MSNTVKIDPTIDAISSAGEGKTKQSFLVNLLTGWNAGVFIAIGASLATIVSKKVGAEWGGLCSRQSFLLDLLASLLWVVPIYLQETV